LFFFFSVPWLADAHGDQEERRGLAAAQTLPASPRASSGCFSFLSFKNSI
jgi:hypothetical protein